MTPWTGRSQELDEFWTTPVVPDYRAKMIHFICKFLSENEGYTVLDAGCGTGIMWKLLPSWARERYMGMDFTEEMVEYCRAHHHFGDFRQGDICRSADIPSADLVVTQNVLQHIVPWQIAAFNLSRSARKGVIFCERSDRRHTRLTMKDPVISRCFNEGDMVRFLEVIGKMRSTACQRPRILARPRSTQNRNNVLTIYGMRWG